MQINSGFETLKLHIRDDSKTNRRSNYGTACGIRLQGCEQRISVEGVIARERHRAYQSGSYRTFRTVYIAISEAATCQRCIEYVKRNGT